MPFAMSAFSRPERCGTIKKQPAQYHLVAKATGGMKRLFDQIRTNSVPDLPDYGSFTDVSGCFDAGEGQCLLALRYKYLGVLGSGQSAVVIKAQDRFCGDRPVAIKILHTQFFHLGGQETECFLKLQATDLFGFSQIAKLLNTFTFDDHYCMVFELLYSPDWTRLFHPSDPLSDTEAVYKKIRQVALCLFQVLGFLQTQNVIHADLKPDNLLLKSEDDPSSLKVADLGNAIQCVYNEVSLYYDDFELQTLLYRAPEVIFGLQFGCEVDMWSVGCILAEFFLGNPLFFGNTREEVLKKMVEILGPVPRSLVQRGKFYSELEMFTFGGTQPDATSSLRAVMEKGRVKKCTNYAFVHFLAQLLRYDPAERISHTDAACHQFIAREIGLGYLVPSSANSSGSSRHYPSILVTKDSYTHKPAVDKEILRQHPSSLDLLYIGTSASSSREDTQTEGFAKRRVAEVLPLRFQDTPKLSQADQDTVKRQQTSVVSIRGVQNATGTKCESRQSANRRVSSENLHHVSRVGNENDTKNSQQGTTRTNTQQRLSSKSQMVDCADSGNRKVQGSRTGDRTSVLHNMLSKSPQVSNNENESRLEQGNDKNTNRTLRQQNEVSYTVDKNVNGSPFDDPNANRKLKQQTVASTLPQVSDTLHDNGNDTVQDSSITTLTHQSLMSESSKVFHCVSQSRNQTGQGNQKITKESPQQNVSQKLYQTSSSTCESDSRASNQRAKKTLQPHNVQIKLCHTKEIVLSQKGENNHSGHQNNDFPNKQFDAKKYLNFNIEPENISSNNNDQKGKSCTKEIRNSHQNVLDGSDHNEGNLRSKRKIKQSAEELKKNSQGSINDDSTPLRIDANVQQMPESSAFHQRDIAQFREGEKKSVEVQNVMPRQVKQKFDREIHVNTEDGVNHLSNLHESLVDLNKYRSKDQQKTKIVDTPKGKKTEQNKLLHDPKRQNVQGRPLPDNVKKFKALISQPYIHSEKQDDFFLDESFKPRTSETSLSKSIDVDKDSEHLNQHSVISEPKLFTNKKNSFIYESPETFSVNNVHRELKCHDRNIISEDIHETDSLSSKDFYSKETYPTVPKSLDGDSSQPENKTRVKSHGSNIIKSKQLKRKGSSRSKFQDEKKSILSTTLHSRKLQSPHKIENVGLVNRMKTKNLGKSGNDGWKGKTFNESRKTKSGKEMVLSLSERNLLKIKLDQSFQELQNSKHEEEIDPYELSLSPDRFHQDAVENSESCKPSKSVSSGMSSKRKVRNSNKAIPIPLDSAEREFMDRSSNAYSCSPVKGLSAQSCSKKRNLKTNTDSRKHHKIEEDLLKSSEQYLQILSSENDCSDTELYSQKKHRKDQTKGSMDVSSDAGLFKTSCYRKPRSRSPDCHSFKHRSAHVSLDDNEDREENFPYNFPSSPYDLKKIPNTNVHSLGKVKRCSFSYKGAFCTNLSKSESNVASQNIEKTTLLGEENRLKSLASDSKDEVKIGLPETDSTSDLTTFRKGTKYTKSIVRNFKNVKMQKLYNEQEKSKETGIDVNRPNANHLDFLNSRKGVGHKIPKTCKESVHISSKSSDFDSTFVKSDTDQGAGTSSSYSDESTDSEERSLSPVSFNSGSKRYSICDESSSDGVSSPEKDILKMKKSTPGNLSNSYNGSNKIRPPSTQVENKYNRESGVNKKTASYEEDEEIVLLDL